MNTPLLLAAGGGFMALWAFNSDKKFVKVLPKISKRTGLVGAGALLLLAAVDYLKDKRDVKLLTHTSPPKVPHPMQAVGYDARSDYPSRQPLGALTGVGIEQNERNIPSSAISTFPYGPYSHRD